MSPRAAWRLEAAGFTPVYDYTDGKADWLAADLPFDGEAQLIGPLTRRTVPTVADDATTAAARARAEAVGFGPVIVLNPAGIVLGTLRAEQLEQADADTPVAGLLRFGISTVRPSEQVTELVHRMAHRSLTRVVVTRSDGGLVGLFFTEDAPPNEESESDRP
ncbi:MAG: CBS domain-containing protein [Motilibacteraceae bacterium]